MRTYRIRTPLKHKQKVLILEFIFFFLYFLIRYIQIKIYRRLPLSECRSYYIYKYLNSNTCIGPAWKQKKIITPSPPPSLFLRFALLRYDRVST